MKKITDFKFKILFTLGYLLLILIFWYFKIPCIFQHFFGIPCPGCGMTRAIQSALVLDFKSAFSYHLMFFSVPVLYLYFLFNGNLFKNKVINRIVLTVIVIGFTVDWIVNILRTFPFFVNFC